MIDRITTQKIRRFIAEHAYRAIFAPTRDDDIPKLRPRRENEEEFHAEESWWKNYPTQQAALEKQFVTKSSTG
jgi:hypothetical protein